MGTGTNELHTGGRRVRKKKVFLFFRVKNIKRCAILITTIWPQLLLFWKSLTNGGSWPPHHQFHHWSDRDVVASYYLLLASTLWCYIKTDDTKAKLAGRKYPLVDKTSLRTKQDVWEKSRVITACCRAKVLTLNMRWAMHSKLSFNELVW